MTTLINKTGAMAADGVERVEVEAVNNPKQRALYQAREPIYPKLAHGKFRVLKWALLIFMLGVYYLLPWIRWDRGLSAPDQAVLVDFEGRRFYFFFIDIWPQEVYYITGLLILASLALFLVTSILGRVWCGYACPQTVWTDLFIAVERFIEGDRNKRMKLAKAPWSASKVVKKVSKHAIWLAIAAATGGAWVFYFHDAPTVFGQLFVGEAPLSAYFFIGILTFTTYALAGAMREQVCTYMCPWPRIQAAMTDEFALDVTYRHDRGEPRGAHKKGESWESRGDCIDCRQCVVVCPMGIDIRDGAQLECINCALCIDACDSVMKKVGRPTGLIAYDTDINVEARARGEKTTYNLIRPRTVFYAIIMIAVSGIMLFGLTTRASVDVNVLHDRNPTFVRLSDGSIRNGYTLKILNKAYEGRDFRVTFEAPDGLDVKVVGGQNSGDSMIVAAEPDSVRTVRLYLTLPQSALEDASTPVVFHVEEIETGESKSNPTVFISR